GVPLLGRLIAALRGCWTLPVWRQALRDDVQGLRHEFHQLRDRQQNLQERMAEALPRHDAERWMADEIQARWHEIDAALAEARRREQRWRQDDTQRLRVAEASLQEIERQWQAMRDMLSALAP